MAFSFADSSASIGTTEYSLARGANYDVSTLVQVDAVVQPVIDASAMLAGDQYQFRLYRKVNGTVRLVFESILTGVQASALAFPATLASSAGWDVTAKRLAGSDRTLAWSDGRLTADAVPTTTQIRDALLDYAHETGRTFRGVIRRLDALMTGKATGLLGSLATFYRADGATKAIEATQDVALGTRETASTVGGD